MRVNTTRQAVILIVDDTPQNLAVVFDSGEQEEN